MMESGPNPTASGCRPSEDPVRENAALFPAEPPPERTAEEEKLKRAIYEKMNPRRRKFIDKIGYEQWDPFQPPKDPLDLRTDRTRRTLQDLIGEFMRQNAAQEHGEEWKKGVRECALGIIKKEEKYQGIFDFCLWYNRLLKDEGHL